MDGSHAQRLVEPERHMTAEIGAVCIPNISFQERRKRLQGGMAMGIFSLIVLAILVATGVNPWWRLGLAPVFAAAAAGFFQWRDKT